MAREVTVYGEYVVLMAMSDRAVCTSICVRGGR